MLYIIWNQENELGIPILDEQHRGIVSTINSLHYFLRAGEGLQALTPTINILVQYAKIHFQTEQSLMAAVRYPQLSLHLALHGEFVKRLAAIQLEIASKKDPSILLVFLKDWWLGHINDKDRLYVPYMQNHRESI